MIYRLPGKKQAVIDTAEGLSLYGEGAEAAAGFLMKLALRAHASVVVMGKKPDFYQYVKDEDIPYISYMSSKVLFEELDYPFIADLKAPSRNALKEVMEEAGQGRDLVHLKKRSGKEPYLEPPGLALAFYQLKDRGSRKDRVLVEALFAALLTDASKERMRETVVFFDAPYRPFTKRAMSAIKAADRAGCALIGLYKENAPKKPTGRFEGHVTDGVFLIKDRDNRKTYRTKLDQAII